MPFSPKPSKCFSHKVQFFPHHLGQKVHLMENPMICKLSNPRTRSLHLGAFQRRREIKTNRVLTRYEPTLLSSHRAFRCLALPGRMWRGIKVPVPPSQKLRGGLRPPQFNLFLSEGEAALREMKRPLPTPVTAGKYQPKSRPWKSQHQ